MGKFSSKPTRAAIVSPVTTVGRTTVTHEGAPAYARDAKSDLFLLAVTNMVGEDSFYESAGDRDMRFRDLVAQVTIADPDWVARFVPFLRNHMHMRSASVVMAAESAHARLIYRDRLAPHTSTIRNLITSALVRADEPAELLAYWHQRFGRSVPISVKRGIADRLAQLTEYEALKYDGTDRAWRLSDVVEMACPRTNANSYSDEVGALWEYLLDRRHHPNKIWANLELLPTVRARRLLESLAPDLRAEVLSGPVAIEHLRDAGMTWENLASWLGRSLTAQDWATVIPTMGYMALLRNLRNFDEAQLPDEVAQQVAKRLSDPEQVARSRQFPFRFWSAYQAAPSLRWAWALEQALNYSTGNIPALPGRTLILIDTSSSMTSTALTKRSTVTPVTAAALFGIALARRCTGQVDVRGFASGVFRHEITPATSVLPEVERFTKRVGEVGHGTQIELALGEYRGHDRIFIFSDMQTMGYHEWPQIPADTPIYGFNLSGYAPSFLDTGRPHRHELGGLSDKVFDMVPLLERGQSTDWPF